MRKLCLFLLTSLALVGCSEVDLSQYDDEEPEVENVKTKKVTFVMKGITEEYSTRATVASAGCTALWVWEGTKLLAHKMSTEDDFDSPTISLTYGSHDLTFIASSSKDQSWADGVWSTSKVVNDFATQMNVTVSSGSSDSRQVQLTRRNSRVNFQTTDNVPDDVTQCHLVVHNYLSLKADLTATNEQDRDVTLDITEYQGKTYSVFVNTLTESVSDEENCDVTIEFMDASNNVLYSYERTIKLKSNRQTTLTGEYFSGTKNAVSLITEWDEPLEVAL